jgi:hypothetical protein
MGRASTLTDSTAGAMYQRLTEGEINCADSQRAVTSNSAQRGRLHLHRRLGHEIDPRERARYNRGIFWASMVLLIALCAHGSVYISRTPPECEGASPICTPVKPSFSERDSGSHPISSANAIPNVD